MRSVAKCLGRSRRGGRRLVGVVFLGALGALATLVPVRTAAGETAFRRTVLLDNDDVQVVELEYAPGSSSAVHTHEFPRRVVYVVAGGTLQFVPARMGAGGSLELVPGAEPRTADLVAGQTLWVPAQAHQVRNVGATVVKVVEVELKR